MRLCGVFILLLFVVSAPVMLGCTPWVHVKPVPLAEPLDIPPDANLPPIRLSRFKVTIPRGATSGAVTNLPGAPNICGWPYFYVPANEIKGEMDYPEMRKAFYETMEGLGYDVTGDPAIMFDDTEDELRAEYSIGARITDIKTNLCAERSFLLRRFEGFSGEASMDVEWTVYDKIRRYTVAKFKTQGYSRREIANFEGAGLLIDDAFAHAAHNLGSHEEFFNLIVFNIKPLKSPNHEGAKYVSPKDYQTLYIEQRALLEEPANQNMEQIRRNAVKISAGIGHGSGFFISEDGHILTNWHVVGEADRVRVVTEKKKYKLAAKVIRKNRKRDVALLKLEEIPDGFEPTLLPIRLSRPDVAEDVYAIGTPRDEHQLQDTVTKGIISAHRYRKYERQEYIQADVDIHGGNSGGPLLDGNGNVIGISVQGVSVPETKFGIGLNYFVPIKDALKQLNIVYE